VNPVLVETLVRSGVDALPLPEFAYCLAAWTYLPFEKSRLTWLRLPEVTIVERRAFITGVTEQSGSFLAESLLKGGLLNLWSDG